MKAWSVLLCALIAVAPAVAICVCASPSRAAQGCEGTDHCCRGDAASKSSRSKDCPRAEKSVDPAEIPENSTEPALAAASILTAVAFNSDLPETPALSEIESRASPPSHPPYLVLTALLL